MTGFSLAQLMGMVMKVVPKHSESTDYILKLHAVLLYCTMIWLNYLYLFSNFAIVQTSRVSDYIVSLLCITVFFTGLLFYSGPGEVR